MDMKRLLRGPVAILVLLVIVFVLVESIARSGPSYKGVDLSQIETAISTHHVQSATLRDKEQQIRVTLNDQAGTKQEASYPDQYGQVLVSEIKAANDKVPASADTTYKTDITKSNVFLSLLGSFLPLILILGLLLFFMNQMQGGGNRVMSFGKSKARLVSKDTPKTTFADVAGIDEAKAELSEVVDFLRKPEKYQRLGGRIPHGVLLSGPPGTGKTLLARAVAGEANVPFFSMSASEFVEAIVGIGAARVRDLFTQAKAAAPAIVFVDELDAIGRSRTSGVAGFSGGNDEREQTLNQILTEMDGFDSSTGVIVIAATTRPDVLDAALVRPGRFDRRVAVQPPDRTGREQILKVHTRSLALGDDVDLARIAATTPGMVGADLANLCNEAALTAARRNHDEISEPDFSDALERIVLGAERQVMMSDDDRRRTA
ncbi:MAG: ATP-dependent metallopeptidase FtsH/Yme1/Tma family protein, partial [Mycobacteriales bacterium]